MKPEIPLNSTNKNQLFYNMYSHKSILELTRISTQREMYPFIGKRRRHEGLLVYDTVVDF